MADEPSCKRCRKSRGFLPLRNETVCDSCFVAFIASKAVKRMGVLRKSLTTMHNSQKTFRYLAGLSFGPSSSALVHLLDDNIKYSRERRKDPPYELAFVHIDTTLTPRSDSPAPSPADDLLRKYRERFPDIPFRCIRLSAALEVSTIDWSNLPPLGDGDDPDAKLLAMFDKLPSVASRVDVMQILVRQLLLATTVASSCDALLLGCTTTALAELTLSEVVKGRGFSVTWKIEDGPVPTSKSEGPVDTLIYYPLRDVFRKEIVTYSKYTSPPMTDMIPTATSTQQVVSHKELSIEEVMLKYFEDVEESYPSVVANVVRTSGKLSRPSDAEWCSLCGTAVDRQGDDRWRGEIGHDDSHVRVDGAGPLCYGCERSIGR